MLFEPWEKGRPVSWTAVIQITQLTCELPSRVVPYLFSVITKSEDLAFMLSGVKERPERRRCPTQSSVHAHNGAPITPLSPKGAFA